MYKILVLLAFVLAGCNKTQPYTQSTSIPPINKDQEVAASLARSESVAKSTNDMFEEISIKAKAGS